MGSRRAFIAGAAGAAALLPVHGTPLAAPAPEAAPAAGSKTNLTGPFGYTLFGPEEAAFVEAMVNVMCPADALTPSGIDCGLVDLHRPPAGRRLRQGRALVLAGPWLPGKPQQGYQLPLKPAEFFKAGSLRRAAPRKRASARRSISSRPRTPTHSCRTSPPAR